MDVKQKLNERQKLISEFKDVETFEELQNFIKKVYRKGYRIKTKKSGTRAHTFRQYGRKRGSEIVKYYYSGRDYDGKSKIRNLHRHLTVE